jgi:hypothetical protein
MENKKFKVVHREHRLKGRKVTAHNGTIAIKEGELA